MKRFRWESVGLSVLSMILVLAIVGVVLGASTVFYHSEWLALTGLALFVLAALPAFRDLIGSSSSDGLIVERRATGKKIPISLVAVSSAAILAIYAAGYDRTGSAAARFEGEASFPRRHAVVDADAPSVVELGAAAPVGTAAPPLATARVSESVTADVAVSAPVPPSALPSPQRSEEKVAVADAAPASADATVAPVLVTAAIPDVKPAETAPVAPTAPSVPVAPPQPLYKDGSYLGWGSCRHGQIQVEVVIQAGKIASAEIAQCLTRYSCSVIRNTPSQLVARQNPDAIDNVSGATQSVDAYYYAVTAALKEAKEGK